MTRPAATDIIDGEAAQKPLFSTMASAPADEWRLQKRVDAFLRPRDTPRANRPVSPGLHTRPSHLHALEMAQDRIGETE